MRTHANKPKRTPRTPRVHRLRKQQRVRFTLRCTRIWAIRAQNPQTRVNTGIAATLLVYEFGVRTVSVGPLKGAQRPHAQVALLEPTRRRAAIAHV